MSDIKDISKSGAIVDNVKAFFSGKNNYSLIVITLGVWIIFQILTKGLFLSPRNLSVVLLQFTILGFASMGMVIIMIVRSIDLSVASVIAFIVILGTLLNTQLGLNPFLVMLIMLIISLLVAAWQGLFVAKVAIPAFVVTLAGQLYFRGASLVISGGKAQIGVGNAIDALTTEYLPKLYSIIFVVILFLFIIFFVILGNQRAKRLGLPHKTIPKLIGSIIPILFILAGFIYIASFEGLPYLVIILVLFTIVFHIILENTALGRFIYAVGDNPTAAKLSGINPVRIIFISFLLMGVAYFFASLGLMSRIDGFVPTMAPLMELNAIAAAVIGGTSLFGGYGTIAGGILGALLLTSIDNGMTLLNVPTFYQQIAKGLILLIALVIDVAVKNKRA